MKTYDDFDAVVRQVRYLQEEGYQSTGRWTLGQICRHLAKTVHFSITAGDHNRQTLLGALRSWVIRFLVLNCKVVKTGIPAPAELEVNEEVSDELGIREYEGAVERFLEYAGEMKFHPAYGKMSKSQWRKAHLHHAAMHLDFLIPQTQE